MLSINNLYERSTSDEVMSVVVINGEAPVDLPGKPSDIW